MDRLWGQLQFGPGSLVEIFDRLAPLFTKVPCQLIHLYRLAAVKHADETGWRTDGQNGHVWLFATDSFSLFQFRKNRSAEVPKSVSGSQTLPGVLVVAPYAGYNKAPCAIQYGYAHLLRGVQDLEKEFPDSGEVKQFVSALAPLLTLAMGLRNQAISKKRSRSQAAKIKAQIVDSVQAPAQHLGIRRIQDIFRKKADRMVHGADNRGVTYISFFILTHDSSVARIVARCSNS